MCMYIYIYMCVCARLFNRIRFYTMYDYDDDAGGYELL